MSRDLGSMSAIIWGLPSARAAAIPIAGILSGMVVVYGVCIHEGAYGVNSRGEPRPWYALALVSAPALLSCFGFVVFATRHVRRALRSGIRVQGNIESSVANGEVQTVTFSYFWQGRPLSGEITACLSSGIVPGARVVGIGPCTIAVDAKHPENAVPDGLF